jgi:hypothetical protein
MKFTDREKLLILIAPLVLVLGGYGWWYNIFQRPKSIAIEQAHTGALAAQPKPSELLAQQSRKKMLDREFAGLQKQKEDLDSQVAVAAGREVDSRRRIENENLLGALLRRHGLQIVDEGLVGNTSQARLPFSVTEALARFGKSTAQQTAQVRRLKISGTYNEVLAAMGELAAMDTPPGVPISLSMAEADIQEVQRTWTLLVWI